MTGPFSPQDRRKPGEEPERDIAAGTRALVVCPHVSRGSAAARAGQGGHSARAGEVLRSPQARLEEAAGLAGAIDLAVVGTLLVPLAALRPSTYLGKGKVEEIAGLVKADEVNLVVVDAALSPVQQRNLEKAWAAKVIDRTGLILEIFGRRARTKEGTLQVELAHLDYQKSRLVRSWTHLERQRGGFGFLGGPGETQIETDRRLIQERMARIEHDLEAVKRTRGLHRASRQRVPYPIVALVGYTNAGKSTLFNRLTKAQVLAADMLFATLDPTSRAIGLPHGEKAILSDTVGFISDLPTMLVAAFRATLEDVIEATIVLHVRDVAHEDTEAQAADVRKVLGDLGIDANDDGRLIEVWNKIDLLDEAGRARLANQAATRKAVPVSALTGEGADALLAAIEERLARSRSVFVVELDPADGSGRHWLHEHTEVLERRDTEEGTTVAVVRVAPERIGVFERRFPRARMRG